MPNQPPVIGADVLVLWKNSPPVTGNVLANDIDPDGDPLAVVNFGTKTKQRGVLVINSDGSYVFTINANHPDIVAMQLGQGWALPFDLTISDGHNEVHTTMRVEIWGFNAGGDEDGDESACNDISVILCL